MACCWLGSRMLCRKLQLKALVLIQGYMEALMGMLMQMVLAGLHAHKQREATGAASRVALMGKKIITSVGHVLGQQAADCAGSCSWKPRP